MVRVSVTSDDEWRRLCGVMGNEELADDSRLATCVERRRHADDLDVIMSEWLATQKVEEVAHRLQAARVAAGVVQNDADLVKDPQLRHRDYFQGISINLGFGIVRTEFWSGVELCNRVSAILTMLSVFRGWKVKAIRCPD